MTVGEPYIGPVIGLREGKPMMGPTRGRNPKKGPQKRENTPTLGLNWAPNEGPINPKDEKKNMPGKESKWAC